MQNDLSASLMQPGDDMLQRIQETASEGIRWWILLVISLDIWIPVIALLWLAQGGTIRDRISWIFLQTPSGGLVISSMALGACLGIGILLFILFVPEYLRDIARALELRSYYQLVAGKLPANQNVYSGAEFLSELPRMREAERKALGLSQETQREVIEKQIRESLGSQLNISVREDDTDDRSG